MEGSIMTKYKLALAGLAFLALTGTAMADPIEGFWKTEAGTKAEIAPCGAEFCITLKDGKHAGKQIGHMALKNPGRYEGEVTDPADDKTYAGKAELNDSGLKLTGCAALIFCKSQSWLRL
jgi:uncharacterized protein (DUF2147 family)